MHFDVFPLHPFLDSFLHCTVLTFSSTALSMMLILISWDGLLRIYPPLGPLILLTMLFLI